MYGVPGSGAYSWTARFGTVWVGSTWGPYHQQGHECGGLGAPVKPYGYLSEFDAAGQWFVGGAIYWKYGYWHIVLGDWGQTAGRFAEDPDTPASRGAEEPPGANQEVPPEPEVTLEMSRS